MDATAERLRLLETLVDELLKESPAEEVVSACMDRAGIPDSGDPIDRINKVLLALNFSEKGKEFEE